jgi:hypothetical protein
MLRAIAFAAALLAPVPALAQTVEEVNARIESLLGSHEVFETAIDAIQSAVSEASVEGVAGYIPFGEPIKVNGEDVVIADKADLAARFEELFNDKVTMAVSEQDYANLFVNQDGIMFGNGELWLGGVCVDDTCDDFFVNIIAINNE